MPMIEQLKRVLSAEGDDISALLTILSKQEQIKLKRYFTPESNSLAFNTDDINIKFYALNALFIYIKNNPSIEDQLKSSDIDIDQIAVKIYELANIIYTKQPTWVHFFYVVAYATLANKSTLLTEDEQPAENSELANKVLKFFIDFAFPIKKQQDIDTQKANLVALKLQFKANQENAQSQQQLFEIIAISNLVSLADNIQTYLLEGAGANISAQINNQVADAIKVFADTGNRKWELICSLLRLLLHKYHENSIWTYANRLPFFKDFVKLQLKQGSFLFSLFHSQKTALQHILASNKSTVISMPTSSGKTLLAELKILYTRSTYSNDCLCAYIIPTNALVNQTLKHLKTSFSNLKVEQLLPYNHFDSLEKDLVGEPDILVATPEKFNFLLKSEENILDKLRLIIVDEAHNISDPNRGSIWEFLLANLKQNDEQLSYLLLTPFIQNKDVLAQWLDNNSYVAKSIEWTPTKQYPAYHSLHSNKTTSKINYLPSARNSIIKEDVTIDLAVNLKSRQKELDEETINAVVRNSVLVEKYAKQKGCILILHNGAPTVEKLANKLATQFNFYSKHQSTQIEYAKQIISLELGEGHSLLELLDKGIAFHHSQLSPLVKEAVEYLVSKDAIKVLVATTTLAQGMNFPIKTVIFETLTLGGGAGSKKLSYSDFWNIAGRAGRAYKDTEGHIVLGWGGSIEATRNKLQDFIARDAEATISSLKAFFDELQDNQVIDYQFIKDSPIAQNFLHYLNHLLNISFQYKLDKVKRQDIANILGNSLYFKQNEFEEGFLETQEKVVNFSNQYITSIKDKSANQLKLADTLGITDVSLSTIIGIIKNQDNLPLLSECIGKNNKNGLAIIIDAINSIPELKISLRQEGFFKPELIAGILLDWINGKSIANISVNNQLSTNECAGYIFSKLKNYIPWGMAIYQKISSDDNDLLPSYAFYGVKNKQHVKLAYLGVPRFALDKVATYISDDALYNDTSKLKSFLKDTLKNKAISLDENNNKNVIINTIIEKSII